MKLARYTGRGIRVGIVDSGVEHSHPAVGKACQGICITVVNDHLSYCEDYHDNVGHSTACAAIIHKAYVLVVDASDSLEWIQDSIHVLEAVGRGRTIATVLNARKMNGKLVAPSFEPLPERMTQAEMEESLRTLEGALGLPAMSIACESGQNRLVEVVIDYFAEGSSEHECVERRAGSVKRDA